MKESKLEFSVPANNQKVIDIYNRLRSQQLVVNTNYQRKLVWKKAHKVNFIDTILRNYPFPEIYIAPGALDQDNLILIDEIVDGQQRLTTIRDYIEGTDIFALKGLSIPAFSELDQSSKVSFLNYEVSVRYLKNIEPPQVRDIFQRINKTDYALNSVERINAQWGDSEFVCFAKQLIEEKFESDSVQYLIPEQERTELVAFFNGDDEDEEGIFSETDVSRMYALQYVMTLVATLAGGEYFPRNERLGAYIESFNDSFGMAEEIKFRLLRIIRLLNETPISRTSRWYKKANLFTIIVELDKIDISSISTEKLGMQLNDLDRRAGVHELGLEIAEVEPLHAEDIRYFSYAREAVNQKTARLYRGNFIRSIILRCLDQ